MDFKSCRDFLNKGSDHRIEDEEIDFGLEKVDSLSDSLSKSREKANVLGFGMVDEKEKKEELMIGKEVQGTTEERGLEAPAPERDHGKEEGKRPAEREREREYKPERGGMEMGI